jgi:hypothetical protein
VHFLQAGQRTPINWRGSVCPAEIGVSKIGSPPEDLPWLSEIEFRPPRKSYLILGVSSALVGMIKAPVCAAIAGGGATKCDTALAPRLLALPIRRRTSARRSIRPRQLSGRVHDTDRQESKLKLTAGKAQANVESPSLRGSRLAVLP